MTPKGAEKSPGFFIQKRKTNLHKSVLSVSDKLQSRLVLFMKNIF